MAYYFVETESSVDYGNFNADFDSLLDYQPMAQRLVENEGPGRYKVAIIDFDRNKSMIFVFEVEKRVSCTVY